MLIDKLEYINSNWKIEKKGIEDKTPDIIFMFGKRVEIQDSKIYSKLRILYPYSDIVGCSSSGNILDDRLSTANIIAVAIYLERGSIRVSIRDFLKDDNQIKIGRDLILTLPNENLKHIFILSDGLNVNGSQLIEGANTCNS